MGTARGLRAVVLGNLAGLTRQRGSRVSTREIWNRRRRGSAGHDGRGRGIFAAPRIFHRTRRLPPVRPLVTPGISRSRRLRCGKARGRGGQKTGRIVPRLRRFRNAKRRGGRELTFFGAGMIMPAIAPRARRREQRTADPFDGDSHRNTRARGPLRPDLASCGRRKSRVVRFRVSRFGGRRP